LCLDKIWGKREPNPDEDLVLVVSERLGSAFLDRVLHSNFIEAQRSVMHGDDTELARAVWDATVAKSRLPKCREDLEEAVGRWMMSETVEDEERAAIFRDLVREMETEEISAEALWNRLGGASAGATIH
jgi:hypothetical protein